MKSATTAMQTHIAGDVTTLATLWLLEQNINAVGKKPTLACDDCFEPSSVFVQPGGVGVPLDAMCLDTLNHNIYYTDQPGGAGTQVRICALDVYSGTYRVANIIGCTGTGGCPVTDGVFIYVAGSGQNGDPIWQILCSTLQTVQQAGSYSADLVPHHGCQNAVATCLFTHPNGLHYYAVLGILGWVTVCSENVFSSGWAYGSAGGGTGKAVCADRYGVVYTMRSGGWITGFNAANSGIGDGAWDLTATFPTGASFMCYNPANHSLIVATTSKAAVFDLATHAVTVVNATFHADAFSQSAFQNGIQGAFLTIGGGTGWIRYDPATLQPVETWSESGDYGYTKTLFGNLYDVTTNCIWFIQGGPGGVVQFCMGQGTGADASSIGFTDHDRDIVYNGVTYVAHSSGERSNVRNSATLAVDNLEIVGIFEGDGLSKEDIRAGKWDYATVKVFMVNWNDLTMGDIKLRKGRIGQVSLLDQEYKTELRGLSDEFSRSIVEVTTPDCRADLFDQRCKLSADAFRRSGSVGALVTFNDPTDPTSGIDTLPHPDTSGGGGTPVVVPPPVGGGGNPTPVDGAGLPVVGSQSTLTLETGNNTSAFSDYRKTSAIAEVHANFTGITHIDAANVAKDDNVYDDSLNESVPNLTQVAVNAGGNVSKLPIKSLLYTGCTAKMFMHFMLWWKNPKTDHVNIGYVSDNAAQVARQVADIKSRGWDVIIPSWYGTAAIPASGHATSYDHCTQLIKAECERRNDIEFAISVEHGAIQASANKQQDLITLLNYCADNYYISAKYARLGGRPVVHFFGLEVYNSSLNWTTIRNSVRGNPLFIFRNRNGFNNYGAGQADGAFAWLDTGADSSSDPSALAYLKDFYNGAKTQSGKIAFADCYKGFNGTMTYSTGWSDRKNIAADNGRTWLRTVRLINQFYNSGNQVAAIMGVTWNDWEEGTALEPGIENAVVVTAAVASNTLTWTTTGGAGLLAGATSEDTVHHYTVFYSTDGQNLTVLANYAVSAGKSVNLTTAMSLLPAGTYKLRVKATGHSHIRNQMSNEVTWVKV